MGKSRVESEMESRTLEARCWAWVGVLMSAVWAFGWFDKRGWDWGWGGGAGCEEREVEGV